MPGDFTEGIRKPANGEGVGRKESRFLQHFLAYICNIKQLSQISDILEISLNVCT